MKKARLFIVLGIFLLVIGIIYRITSNTSSSSNNNKIQVIASFYPVYFFASAIGGDRSDVYNLTPAGTEPHDYEPSAQDMARIENSSLLILNGAALEPWGDEIKEGLKGKKTIMIKASDFLANQQFEDDGKTVIDPHVWLSPKLAKLEIDAILNGFIQVDSTNKEYYVKNADALKQQIDELDEKFNQGLANCSHSDFVTSHAAFGYMASAYKLNQVPISGISPDEEPSTKQLIEVADFARKNNVKYIFFESLVSPKLSETIAVEVGAKTLVLDPIEGISDEDLKQGNNYFTVMENNLKNLRVALECKQTF